MYGFYFCSYNTAKTSLCAYCVDVFLLLVIKEIWNARRRISLALMVIAMFAGKILLVGSD